MLHPNVVTQRIPMRTRHRKPPLHRPRHKDQLRPLPPFLAPANQPPPKSHQVFPPQVSPPNKKRGPQKRRGTASNDDDLLILYQLDIPKCDTLTGNISPTKPTTSPKSSPQAPLTRIHTNRVATGLAPSRPLQRSASNIISIRPQLPRSYLTFPPPRHKVVTECVFPTLIQIL